MLKIKSGGFVQLLLTILLLPVLCLGQVAAGGSVPENAGAAGAGKAGNPIARKLYSTVNRQVFVKLAQRTVKNKTVKKAASATPAGKVPARENARNPLQKNPTQNIGSSTSSNLQTPSIHGVLTFQPVGETGFEKELTDLLTPKSDEKDALLSIFRETKNAYQAEALKLNRANDLALSITFFISTCLTVYHQTPEPEDDAAEVLYQSVAESMWETPEIGQMSNQEKQLASDKLVYVTGLIYSGYLLSKEAGDRETMQLYRQMARDCFNSFTNLSADDYKFEKSGLVRVK
jgi:hypothetical protein